MSQLWDQIDADAEVRLALPPGLSPPEAIDRFQKFLRIESHRVKGHHRRGTSGQDVCQARARIYDHLLRRLFSPHPAPDGGQPRAALVATGGYGRSELNPGSDLEVICLQEGEGDLPTNGGLPGFLDLLEGPALAPWLPSVAIIPRTIGAWVESANGDLRATTAAIEARLIAGDAALFARFQKALRAGCVRGQERALIATRLEDQAARWAKYGKAVCLQEPHIKHGCGGLRDYQSLLWMIFLKHRGGNLGDLERARLIQKSERRELEAAYDFLLRVRTEAHYVTGRANDVLTKSIQPAVAHGLGYKQRSLSDRIERFMRAYYQQARTLHLLVRALEERLALAPPPAPLRDRPSRRKRDPYVIDGFTFVGGRIRAARRDVFQEDPSRLMRVFRHAQQRGLRLDPELAQLLRQEVRTLGKPFRCDPRVHQSFLEILSQRGNVAPILRAMHEIGLLGAYLPPFGRLTCLAQHEFYHQYTADEHTLVCLAKLDELAAAKTGSLGAYTEIFHQDVDRPYVLYLAVLLHDVGKARRTSDHAEDGRRIAAAVARRMGLDAGAVATLCFLVQQHLAMVAVSQRRDLDEPVEIERFAALVGSAERLSLLTLHTVADSLGTSDKLWNGFKDTLLLTLYRRTRALLLGGAAGRQAEAEQRARVAHEVRSLLPPDFPEDEVAAHFGQMPSRYFLLREPKPIAADLEVAHRLLAHAAADDGNPLAPVVLWHHEPDRGYSVVRVSTWDRPGLFSRVCGALTAAGLNILSAEIFTRGDSIVIDTFCVVDAVKGALAEEREQERFTRCLREVIAEGVDLRPVIARRRPAQPIYDRAGREPIPTRIRFDNHAAEARTLIEIVTEDRVGLLFAMTQVFADVGLDISVAKIGTERGAACDSFYVREAGGAKVEDPARQRAIEARLHAAIAGLE